MFSVKDFLDLNQVSTYNLVSAHDKIADIAIDYIAIYELPTNDFIRNDFIRVNEIVMATYNFLDNKYLIKYLKEIKSQSASGLVLTCKDDFTLDQEVVDIANDIGLPILIVPWELRYSDIIEELLFKTKNNLLGDVFLFQQIQDELVDLYLKDGTLEDAIMYVESKLGVKIKILDEYKDKAIKLASSNKIYGYLVIDNLDSVYNISLLKRYIVTNLILWFDKEWIIKKNELNLKDYFVNYLLMIKNSQYKQFASQADDLGIDIDLKYYCLCAKVSSDYKEEWINNHWEVIRQYLADISEKLNQTVFFTNLNNRIVILIENSESFVQEMHQLFIDTFENILKKNYSDIQLLWGISNVYNKAHIFNLIYSEAADALLITDKNKQIVRYSEIIDTRIIREISENTFLKEDLLMLIEKLTNHTDLYLLETFETYLKYRNISETARKLNLHRQSLIYRLNKIEELLSINIKSVNNLYQFDIAIKLYHEENK